MVYRSPPAAVTLLGERFFVHDVRHLRRIAAVVAFENVDESLHTPPSHAFVWIDIQTCNLRAAGKMMEQTATIRDFRIKQWRLGRERLFLEYIERCARNDFSFQRFRERFLVHDGAARAVYQVRGRFHQLERIFVDEVISWFVRLALP